MKTVWYRRKPQKVRAVQYTDPTSVVRMQRMFGHDAVVNTKEGVMVSTPLADYFIAKGHWVIENVDGQLLVCSDPVFKKMYESIDKRVTHKL